MKAAVLSFPGSNCDQDLLWATRLVAGATAELVPASARTLTGFDVVMIPGGFSYGDYLCSGAIASLAPIMAAVQRFAAAGGYIIGICNGFQILTAAGLLPGALQSNAQLDFVCAPAPLTVVNNSTAFTNAYADGAQITLPIAHGEGNYYADADTLASLERHHQVVFRYQHNPNGSAHDIAGITNRAGNVLGMMPHPERAVEAILGGTDGLGVFTSLLTATKEAAYAGR
ncbi:phosphoribosylformylglycinamidine synthase subunit PurQ [Lacticaseibacillus thailandensis]|uniref:Phosphoribosylformylglycinamidine synthase subunit PurQ n=1 Tax=Lacticaseibacillus thailandensis DSM 22698 = JCM 13996 TaxID=1423810 RepID=A0A0R2C996_9LACO|nr:phosphoribosylformylglycinamidine synthase subunit PurQ [Lacticaseibacillus thailandensis]KRM88366.1 phosphoribosylformylglycinamidine synthase domain-containing protein [Lacticaseibacillus thailandensis DSM 22698 = JCM 13996]